MISPYIYPGLKKSALDPIKMMDRIIRQISAEFDVAPEKMLSRSRKREFVEPRHACIYLMQRSRVPLTLREIGDRMGGYHHCTSLWAIRSTQNKIDTDPKFAERINNVKSRI